MTEYSKKTVAELTEILKSRTLPHTGKKAELIARLQENDKESETVSSTPATSGPAVAAPSKTPAQSKPSVAPTTAATPATTEPAVSSDTDAAKPAEADSTEATEASNVSYALNLPSSTLDSEIAKRKARAERFGTGSTTATNPTDAAVENTPQAASDSEAIKALERAKRFGIPAGGTDTGSSTAAGTAISKLDVALPTERLRGDRKRKAENDAPVASSLDDPGLRRGFASRGRGSGRGGRFAHRNRGGGAGAGGGATTASKPQGVNKDRGRAPAYVSDKDRAAAEARKKKFATA